MEQRLLNRSSFSQEHIVEHVTIDFAHMEEFDEETFLVYATLLFRCEMPFPIAIPVNKLLVKDVEGMKSVGLTIAKQIPHVGDRVKIVPTEGGGQDIQIVGRRKGGHRA
jgi:hypothetical protein